MSTIWHDWEERCNPDIPLIDDSSVDQRVAGYCGWLWRIRVDRVCVFSGCTPPVAGPFCGARASPAALAPIISRTFDRSGSTALTPSAPTIEPDSTVHVHLSYINSLCIHKVDKSYTAWKPPKSLTWLLPCYGHRSQPLGPDFILKAKSKFVLGRPQLGFGKHCLLQPIIEHPGGAILFPNSFLSESSGSESVFCGAFVTWTRRLGVVCVIPRVVHSCQYMQHCFTHLQRFRMYVRVRTELFLRTYVTLRKATKQLHEQ